ncbi:hypothetical protein [Corynebacterium ulceribovis]|uniref:hypothetical protein n=1 Tax=Corynebacterium ulceribovis TaxID=487732 RepID=UPI0003655703|nr:hypothetical protein [Corynebacterium ulceribovis]
MTEKVSRGRRRVRRIANGDTAALNPQRTALTPRHRDAQKIQTLDEPAPETIEELEKSTLNNEFWAEEEPPHYSER